MTTFTFHTDPGHGWLEVSASALASVDLSPSDFSAYSFQQGSVVYLEEDCDANIFIMAHESKHGPISVVEKFCNFEHWIRKLPRIECKTDDEIWF